MPFFVQLKYFVSESQIQTPSSPRTIKVSLLDGSNSFHQAATVYQCTVIHVHGKIHPLHETSHQADHICFKEHTQIVQDEVHQQIPSRF